jgi:hypothetical protein
MLRRSFFIPAGLGIGVILLWLIAAGSDNPHRARVTSAQEKRASFLERGSAKENNEKMLVRTMRAWIQAGAARLQEVDARTDPIPAAVSEDYEAGLRAWRSYLVQTGNEASYDLAELAGSTFFQLVEIGSTDPDKATANAAGAVRAQKIICRHTADLLTLSNLASYEYFNGEYSAGDRAARRAAADIVGEGGDFGPRDVIAQLNEYKERGEKFTARLKRGFETLEESGDDELGYAIKGYGSHAGLNGYEPGTAPAPGEIAS